MTTSERKSIACIGECMIEISIDDDESQVGFAGDTLNTAIYLKRSAGSALDVSYVTVIGSDPLSDRMDKFIRSEGVSTNCVFSHYEKQPGIYAISTDDFGERSFTYWREYSAARTMFEPSSPLQLSSLAEFDVVYYSAITLAILSPDVRAQFFTWLESYRKNGGLVAFDSNFRPKLWSSVKTAKSNIDRAWELCDIALPSWDDEAALFGEKTPEETLSRFNHYNIKSGALKNGSAGPFMFTDGLDENTYSTVENIVDTTAAGDSFNGAFLASFLTGASNDAAALAGHNQAIKVISRKGAIIAR